MSDVITEEDSEPLHPAPAHVTSRDIAAAAGVSQATVSNVLNRPDLVAPATRERIEKLIRDQGFVVNSYARGLRMGTSLALGVIVLDLANPFWGEVMRGIEAAASNAHYPLLFGSSDEREDKEAELLGLFEERRVRGVLVSSVQADSPALRRLAAHGTKIVLLDQASAGDRYSSVKQNQFRGAQLAAEHMIERGHTRIAFINGPHSRPWCAERLDGLRAGVTARGLDPDRTIVEIPIDSMTAHGAEPATDQLLTIADRPTAIFCVNDLVALGMLQQFSQRGIRVPDDFSLVGFDDSYFAPLLSPALTTIRQHPYALGKRAAEIMISDEQTDGPATVLFEPELIVRDSVAVLNG